MELFRNHLLRDLPPETQSDLLPHMERVEFKAGDVLYETGQSATKVYFPESGVISLVSHVSGHEIDSSIIGREGLVGMPILLGQERTLSDAVVLIEGEGLSMPAGALERKFKEGGPLQERLLAYVAAVLAQSTQLALCSHVHTPQERLARWLLMIADRAGSPGTGTSNAESKSECSLQFNLAPEFLAQMVGTDVVNATAQVGVMERAGLLSFGGTHFELCSRSEMIDASCDCYVFIRDAFGRSEGASATRI